MIHRRRDSSAPWTPIALEADGLAVDELDDEHALMHETVVERAEQHEVVEARGAALPPEHDVVRVQGAVAGETIDDAAFVSAFQGAPLVGSARRCFRGNTPQELCSRLDGGHHPRSVIDGQAGERRHCGTAVLWRDVQKRETGRKHSWCFNVH